MVYAAPSSALILPRKSFGTLCCISSVLYTHSTAEPGAGGGGMILFSSHSCCGPYIGQCKSCQPALHRPPCLPSPMARTNVDASTHTMFGAMNIRPWARGRQAGGGSQQIMAVGMHQRITHQIEAGNEPPPLLLLQHASAASPQKQHTAALTNPAKKRQ